MAKLFYSFVFIFYRSLTAFTKRNSIVPNFQIDQLPPSLIVDKRKKDNFVDMRGGKMFFTETLSCCPTFTRYGPINHAVDDHGMLVELYLQPGEEQKFYMTYCVGERKGKPCGFIDERVKKFSECVQKYSYQYAIARRWGSNDMYSLTAIRMPTGCHCEIKPPRWSQYG